MRGSTGVPTASALLSGGSERGSSRAAGRRRPARSAKSDRNGRVARNDSIEAVSVGGDFSIVSWSAVGSSANAAKVSAIFANRRAWTSATGATCAADSPSSTKKRSRPVSGSARLLMTGTRSPEEAG